MQNINVIINQTYNNPRKYSVHGPRGQATWLFPKYHLNSIHSLARLVPLFAIDRPFLADQ